ncbi:excisionase family DNA-binding protein [Cellulomonas humilata]|uniref:Excisionase family DNA-binding protein n=2 Tax=Cellulomonadaceae TaxID=85016 RepID=A0A7Y5ZXD2_9CELL|nr:excisionase family DNA-binding protein [Cellulomonas humilata]
MEPDDRILLTVVEAARRLGVGRSLMYELLGSGQVESIHIGRLHKVPIDALETFVARTRADSRPSSTGATASTQRRADGTDR